MVRRRAVVALVAAAIATLLWLGSSSFQALAAPQTGAAATTESTLDSYRSALLALRRPANMNFEYTVTRSGPKRIVTEEHRVYWTSAGQERNDTIAINGTQVVPALSRLLRRSTWPYDVGQFAVSAGEYDATATGGALVSGRKVYGFRLVRKAPGGFALTSLYVDAKRRLPIRETFVVAGAGCAGSGVIDFGAAGLYWLPNFISVVCSALGPAGAAAAIFKESIRFGNYHFPAVIPPDVFVKASPAQGGVEALPAGP